MKKLLVVLCAFALVGMFSTAALAAPSAVATVALTIDPYVAVSFDAVGASFDVVVWDGGTSGGPYCDGQAWTALANTPATLTMTLVPPIGPGVWTPAVPVIVPILPGITPGSITVCVSGIAPTDLAGLYVGGTATVTIVAP